MTNNEAQDLYAEQVKDDVIQPAFKMALQYCKIPPTPADVFEAMNRIAKLNAPSAREMWGVLSKAIEDTDRKKYGTNYSYGERTVRGII